MGSNKKINIELEDLNEPVQKAQSRVFPGLSQEGRASFSMDASLAGKKGKKGVMALVSEGIALSRGVAGLIGGSTAWIFTEVILNQDGQANSWAEVIFFSMAFFGFTGAFIAGALKAADDLYVGKNEEAIKSFFIGSMLGLATGMVSGGLAQVVYSTIGGGVEASYFTQLFARTVAFGIAGTLLGLGISLPTQLPKKIKAAAIGGLVGGLAGGFLFDTLGLVLAQVMGGGGAVSRMIGLSITGFAIGIGMAATENAYKDAWLQVVGGPFKGKQFILFKKISWIGRHPGCDIVLIKDPLVADQHCMLSETPNGFRLQTNSMAAVQVYVNDQMVRDKILQIDDKIQIGNSFFIFKASVKKN